MRATGPEISIWETIDAIAHLGTKVQSYGMPSECRFEGSRHAAHRVRAPIALGLEFGDVHHIIQVVSRHAVLVHALKKPATPLSP